jgi:hypothetical protein
VIAFILSGVFPGLGQFYNRQPLKGVAFLGAGIVIGWLLGRVTPTDLDALATPGLTLVGLLGALLAVFLWSVADAWRAAGR